MSGAAERKQIRVPFDLPAKLDFLLHKHQYKVAYGGRGSLKSWSFARALLTLGIQQDLRILCLRETQRSLADSVHLLLTDQIKALGYDDYYHITDNAIRGTARNTLFRFTGLSDETQQSLKSYEGFNIFWFEEAQTMTTRSFQIALPTLFRTAGAEAWVSFNPDLDSGEVWQRFLMHPPDDAVVVEMNWRDAEKCGWMTDENERLRQYDLAHFPDEYENIWEGRPRTFVSGAIYGREITDMVKDGRFRPMPYDPRLPVHRIWDLGWNDLMTVIMVQKPVPSAISIINYIEDCQVTYAEIRQTMNELRYFWGTDWLPHDGEHHDPKSGTNAVKQLRDLGCTTRTIKRTGEGPRIRAARMMFPRVYLDNGRRETPTYRPDQRIGGAHLMDRLKNYRRTKPKSTNEPTTPVHDINCLGPNTLIGTLSGWKRIADLVGKEFHVWGYSEIERRIVPAKAARCWETGVVGRVARVTLDNGSVITCTPEHRFMRRDASWIEAKNLQSRDSLMPLYERGPSAGHQRIDLTDGTIGDSHRYVYSRLVGHLVSGMHIHHLDDDKLNNEPSNLVQLTPAAHCAIHSSTPEHHAHLRRISSRRGGGPEAAAALVEMNRLRSGDNHHTRSPEYWSQERRALAGAAFTRNYKITERPKECLECGGVFLGNYKRCYCCRGCKDRAKSRQAIPESKWRTLRAANIHRPDCLLVAPSNHKVVRVELVMETTAVYDIEVEGIHNFAADGVILHNSHAGDAFGGLAEIVDQIRNEGEDDMLRVTLPTYHSVDATMGLLG